MCTEVIRGTPAKKITNEHGFPQMVDEDGDPICCDCACCTEVNRGQGMLCNKCTTADLMECEHDR